MGYAEGNNTYKEPLLKKYNIPLDHLDFKYVEKCKNGKELERIVRILRSGEEGCYPDLLRKAEERLEIIKPQSKILRTTEPVLTKDSLGSKEWKAVNDDMQEWSDKVKKIDLKLKDHHTNEITTHAPIRQTKTENHSNNTVKEIDKPKRISSSDYEGWDKYDPDTELLKQEIEEEKEKERIKKTIAINQKKAKSVSFSVHESLTKPEAEILANRERELGNECYKAKDYSEAERLYTNSISILPTAAAYNNRCITYLKEKKYELALKDSDQVLKRDPKNVKAFVRKAQILQELGKYQNALECLEELIQFEPNNALAQKMAADIRSKLPRKEIAKVRLSIEEIGSEKKKETKKILVPIPSTSKFTGPSVRIVEVPSDQQEPVKITTTNTNYNRPRPQFRTCRLSLSPKIVELDDGKPTKKTLNVGKTQKNNALKITQIGEKDPKKSTQKNNKIAIQPENTDKSSENLRELKIVEINDDTENQNMEMKKNNENSQKVIELVKGNTADEKCPRNSHALKIVDLNENDRKICIENGRNGTEYQNTEMKKNNDNSKNVVDSLEMTVDENEKEDGLKNEDIKNSDSSLVNLNENLDNDQSHNKIRKTIDVGCRGEPHPKMEDITDVDINSPYEFLKVWQSIKSDEYLESHAKLLRKIQPEDLRPVIGNKLDGTMLSLMLRCLERHFSVPDNIQLVSSFLTELSQLPRFNIISMFLEESDKTAVGNLVSFLIQHGGHLDDVELIRNAYL